MPKYRKKPVEIEAVQFTGKESGFAIADWMRATSGSAPVDCWDEDTMDIATLEGMMTASRGDWIIRGVEGEFYSCRADIFAKTYEPV